MNNVYLGKDAKLQNRHRAGMIRTYRTTPMIKAFAAQALYMLLCVIDAALNFLSRPVIRRAVQSTIAIACIAAFLCLISAVEHQIISLTAAIVIAALLVVAEILCLRRN